MWIGKKKLEEILGDKLEKYLTGNGSVTELKKQVRELKDELESLKTTKKMEQREIEHLVKLKEAKLDIEHQKTELDLKDKYQSMEMKLQTQYHDLIVAKIEKAQQDMKDTYGKIMERLPNITASLEVKRKR